MAPLWATLGKAGAAAAVMALSLGWAAERWRGGPVLLVGAAGLVAGGSIYLAAATLLRMPELAVLRRIVRRGG